MILVSCINVLSLSIWKICNGPSLASHKIIQSKIAKGYEKILFEGVTPLKTSRRKARDLKKA